jgi:hypothetical protein
LRKRRKRKRRRRIAMTKAFEVCPVFVTGKIYDHAVTSTDHAFDYQITAQNAG